ncbi:MAG TPA: MFS transporter [Devosia sp.]|jgi:MFS family permease|uniref:MFS transporter n=1 Tax=Devosia sp. TaxID=1871048 RepID=UPI002DDD5335|nr:MFS transporter [Devosia sp.]HEV2513738.1 MFS transporter [Devosia sp.]
MSNTAPPPMTGQQWLVVLLLLGTGFMLSVDFSILNVAMPEVGEAVGLPFSQLAWIATAYALPAAGFTLLFGRIADLFGRRRMFFIGITLLAIASVLGGFATSPEILLTARALQGLATAIATPAALALLITSFSDERQRARVLGLNGALLSGGFTVGALVGGALVGALSWRWAFFINVPVAVLILAVAPFVLRASSAPVGVRLDLPGATTVTLGLLALVYGVTSANPYVLVGGLVLLALFFIIELRSKAPLVAVSILARPTVKWGNLSALVVFSMEPALIFLVTLYLQDALHLSAFDTGLIFGIPGLSSIVAGIIAGRIIARNGVRNVLAIGLLVQASFTAPLLLLGPDPAWLWVLVPTLFIGFFGHVTAIVASMVTATSGVRDSEQGLATGLVSMTQQVGITIGIPIFGAIAATQAGLIAGIHLALAVNVGVTMLAVVLIWTGLRPRPATAGLDGAAPAKA